MRKPNWRFQSTYDFIHICRERKPQRLRKLATKIRFDYARLKPFEEDIIKIMDFIKEIDIRLHKEEGEDPFTALGQIFHYNISSDLRALIILAITKQYFQMNIILRHFIEFFIVSLWIEIGSRFTGGFDYYLESERWKKYRTEHRLTWRQIEDRLNDIIILNGIRGKNPLEKYFQTANDYDFRLLLALPICDGCAKKNPERNHEKFQTNLRTRRKTQKIEKRRYTKWFSQTPVWSAKKKRQSTDMSWVFRE